MPWMYIIKGLIPYMMLEISAIEVKEAKGAPAELDFACSFLLFSFVLYFRISNYTI
jgi:hypothetical protein